MPQPLWSLAVLLLLQQPPGVVEAFADGEEMILHRVEAFDVVRAEVMLFVEVEDPVRAHGEQRTGAAEIAEIALDVIVETDVFGGFFARRVDLVPANPKYFASRE
jgi:hypothetical protein